MKIKVQDLSIIRQILNFSYIITAMLVFEYVITSNMAGKLKEDFIIINK